MSEIHCNKMTNEMTPNKENACLVKSAEGLHPVRLTPRDDPGNHHS